MKKILLLLLAVSSIALVSAQTPRFGIKAGINIANQNVKLTYMGMSADQNGDAIVGFHIGGVADIPLSPQFSFRPELLLSGKGSKFNGTDDDGNRTEAEIRPYYLEVPLNFVYRHTFPTQLQFFGGFGPSIGYGIFGKGKSGGASDDVFQDGGYKRFDFGFNVLAGLELESGLTFSINFTPGLANIYDGADVVAGASDIKFKNTNVGISIGYMFARKAQ
ncbi:PorT family protein [Pseudoflavitalea sp. X16]|uniref:porin family protein n=1 Tax=Paraflavitalea devenefica TaxID=2716334 RepID=UPI0014246BD6|nr:porin family protein [Paraflavitalea devenefica]NII28272.1 PorT family protein [Paraflavitalea devenefica]